jgi:thiol-disulfide isomerase/thioredoxin
MKTRLRELWQTPRGRRWLLVVVVSAVATGLAAGLLVSPSSSARPLGPLVPAKARMAAPRRDPAVLVPPRLSLNEYRGRVLVVNFWASWCAPCRREAPQLARFASRLDASRAVLVGVDVNDSRSAALGFLRRFRLHDPNGADPDRVLATRYQTPGLPTTVIIDQRGRVAARLLGPQTAGSLRTIVDAVRAAT